MKISLLDATVHDELMVGGGVQAAVCLLAPGVWILATAVQDGRRRCAYSPPRAQQRVRAYRVAAMAVAVLVSLVWCMTNLKQEVAYS